MLVVALTVTMMTNTDIHTYHMVDNDTRRTNGGSGGGGCDGDDDTTVLSELAVTHHMVGMHG